VRLSKQTNYAVRTLIYCAVNEPGLSRVSDISKAYGISEMFLFKIILPVAKNGLLETVRGRRGGVRLSRPADQISLLDVLKVTEESFALSECMGGEENHLCPLAGQCNYTHALQRALAAFFEVIGQYTIADLAKNPRNLETVLGINEREKRPAAIRWSGRLNPLAARVKD
jgi:Rrf2 family transcriptional regulator, iron-responsive regulator